MGYASDQEERNDRVKIPLKRLQKVKQYVACVQSDVSEYGPTPGCTVRSGCLCVSSGLYSVPALGWWEEGAACVPATALLLY